MELEDRVRALEEEIQILKSQIQNTLLDIQEQLLTNAHPTLRSEQAPPAETQAAAPIRSVSFNDDDSYGSDDDDEFAEDTYAADVKVRSVKTASPSQRAARPSRPAQPAPEPAAPHKKQRRAPRPEEMDAWARRKLTEVGPAETARLIRRKAEKGQISPHTRNRLLHLVEAQTPRLTPSNTVQQQPVPAPAPPVRQQPPPPPPPAIVDNDDDATEEDDSHHNTILRLIAGVANAGAGMKWGRNNG